MASAILQRLLDRIPTYVERFTRLKLDFSDAVDTVLENKGWTQKDLANKLGKSESEVSKWLSGQHNLTFQSVAKLEDALGVQLIQVYPFPELQNEAQAATLSANQVNMGLPIVDSMEQKEPMEAEQTQSMDNAVQHTYDHIAHLLAAMNPDKVLELKAPKQMSERLTSLLRQEKEHPLTQGERDELSQYIVLERLIRLAKAHARLKTAV